MTDKTRREKINKTYADLVLLNGKIITVDKNFSIKEAVAVSNGIIIAVGSLVQIGKLIGPETEKIDLAGKTVLPGINDTHAHVDSIASLKPPFALDLNTPPIASIADIVAAIAEKTKSNPVNSWIRGFGYNPALLEECRKDPGRQPARWDLDAVSQEHPVALWDFSHHNMWVNTKGLELAGITKESYDPDGGIIEKNAHGNPTGILRETAAELVESIIPPLTRAEKKTALLMGLKEMNRNGITSYTQPQLLIDDDFIKIYQEIFKEGRLTARVTGMLLLGKDFNEFEGNLKKWEAPQGIDPRWLRFSQIKIMADGIPPAGTAWISTPYVEGGHGSMTINAPSDEEKYDQLLQMIEYGHAKGWQIGIHATGDRTISAILDGFETAQHRYPEQSGKRHYIIHDELIAPADIKRSKALQVAAAMQPYLQTLGADSLASIIGPDLAQRDWPFNSVLKGGVKLTFSSDTPCIPPNWLLGVQAAVLREGFSGTVNGPDECIGREEAIRAYTINGAWQDHMEDIKGSIEVGKLADLSIIDKDILTVPAREIGNISVLMTIVNGDIVYRNQESI